MFLAQRTRKIMTSFSYHSSNLSLIALETMRLLVLITRSLKLHELKKILRIVYYWINCEKFIFLLKNITNTNRDHHFQDIFLEYFILLLFSSLPSHIQVFHPYPLQGFQHYFFHAPLFCVQTGIFGFSSLINWN